MAVHRSKLVIIISLTLLLVAILAAWIWYKGNTPQPEQRVASFEACVQAGYPVTESDPRRCRTPDGQTFTETTISPRGDDDDQATEPETDWYLSQKGTRIQVTAPARGAAINSPLQITGQTPGSWSFEATFPVEILDSDRNVIASHYATVQGEWMTDDYVPFEASITFDAPSSDSGFLVLRKHNASDLPEHNDHVEIPIRFR